MEEKQENTEQRPAQRPGNREQQRQRRERQHQPRKRLRREPEREADIEDFSPWWRRNRAGAPRGGKTAGTPLAGLLWRRRRRDSSGSSVSGAAAQRTSAQTGVSSVLPLPCGGTSRWHRRDFTIPGLQVLGVASGFSGGSTGLCGATDSVESSEISLERAENATDTMLN